MTQQLSQNGSRLSSAEVVVVTGASAGVGRATVRAFAERGARIGLLARGRDGLEAARREVEELGGDALVLPTDVAYESQVERAAAAVVKRFGRIDTWINCAMTSVFSPESEMRGQEYKRVTEVNYLGYVYGTRAALSRMRERNAGSIVQVSSALAFRAIPLQSAYCASKAAIVRFTEALRTELLHEGCEVRLCMVHMPALNTPQFDWVRSRLPKQAQPVPPIFQPEVAAEAIVWAAHHTRRDVAVGGSTLKTIMGEKFAPRMLDRYLSRKGYSAQMTDEEKPPLRRDNLWRPVPGDHGAHGPFDARAKDRSLQLKANLNRMELAAAGIGLLGGILLARNLLARRNGARRLPEHAA